MVDFGSECVKYILVLFNPLNPKFVSIVKNTVRTSKKT
jgi:hypothetical protein